jgi:hypothetical protein
MIFLKVIVALNQRKEAVVDNDYQLQEKEPHSGAAFETLVQRVTFTLPYRANTCTDWSFDPAGNYPATSFQ